MATYDLTVNGTTHSVEAEPEMPLLWALRDMLGLVGTKFGCGISLCGACTVHLNGAPVRSCSTSIALAAGKSVTTIEGLAQGNDLHPLQQSWMDLDVPQCGYCQSGQIMSAAALLKQHPDPTDAQIDAAMAGNYCRCGTYNRIRSAIHAAAGVMVAQNTPQGPQIGSPVAGTQAQV
ncbi:MAG: (2Fe-2S)-binding protein [Proteobacteria bacterium]|nr:(2Fe-2S)-binding protein [Pseudomonadota bacterium]